MNKYSIALKLLLLIGSFPSFSQQLSNPELNIPEPIVPGLIPSILYPGLINMAATNNFNFIRTEVPDVPSSTLTTSSSYVRMNTDYVDGLGRPLQSVARKAHTNGNDIVTAHVYDAHGNEAYKYLPYAAPISGINFLGNPGKMKLNVETQLRGFYDQLGPDEHPFSKTEYDNSPLNRVTKQLAPGRSWVGNDKGVAISYGTNGTWVYSQGSPPVGYQVTGGYPRWTIGDASGAMPVWAGDYGLNKLYVTITTDEDGKSVREYKDKSGRLVIKANALTNKKFIYTLPSDYAYTCYVYDDVGRLRCVIPPEAAKPSGVGIPGGYQFSWGLDQQKLDNLCYQYFYDDHSRLIEKKIPGKAVEYFIYDKRDRQVMYQDGKLRAQNKWLFTLYDALDRPTVTGLSSGSLGRAATQAYIYNTTNYANTTLMYYIKNYNLYHVYPANLTGCDFYSYTYYDNYDQLQNFAYDASFNNVTLPPNGTVVPSTISYQTHGLVTGSKVRVKDPDNPTVNKWLTSVNYYDAKGRQIQTQSENYKGGLDISSHIYYFQGMLWKNIIRHQNPAALIVPGVTDFALNDIVVDRTFERNLNAGGGNDQLYRVTQKIGNGIVYDLARYHYDHLGRTTVKQFTAAEVLQEYNMRGFLNHIQVANSNNNASTQLDPHIFEEKLYYDKGFGSKLYNGNIAGITWKKAGSQAPVEAYGYSYDNLNRLTHAEYRRAPYDNLTNWQKNEYDYTASNITYDLNGNIQSMHQRGLNPPVINSPINMDQLVYNYAANSNQLIKVTDGVTPGTTVSLPDFKDNANYSTEYGYDPNGNMVADANKKITSITYSLLNKPEKITVQDSGTITYVYDAAGNLLQKKVWNMATNATEVYDYMDNFVYKDNVLQYILNEEGRSRPIPVEMASPNNGQFTTKFVYDYFVKDHLGNVRSNVTAEPIDGVYRARHEIVSANIEQLVFDNIPNVRANKPGSTSIDDAMAARLEGSDPKTRIGTAIMLKTMPGDRFNISVDAFYEGEYTQADEVSTEDVIGSLLGTLTGGTNYEGIPIAELPENIRTVTTALGNPNLVGQLDQLLNNNNNPNAPKAHLNYLFFNEKMELMMGNSGSVQVQENITGWTNISPLGGGVTGVAPGTVISPGTGFLLVYIDNQSIGKQVWFDNLMVGMYKGVVAEENHYYPFGLTIETDANQNVTKNPYKYQGIELEKRFGLETYETFYRGLDPQLGRFNSIDPKADSVFGVSPYTSMNNNPVSYVDPKGDVFFLVIPLIVEAAAYTTAAIVTYYAAKKTAEAITNEMQRNTTTSGTQTAPPQAAKGTQNEKVRESVRTGQEAHRQIQEDLKKEGYAAEQNIPLSNGQTVRKDAVKDDEVVIIKPDSKSGIKSGDKREKLMRDNGWRTRRINYDPQDPAYQPGSPTYIGPKIVSPSPF